MPDRRSVNRSMFWRVLRRSVFANRGRLFVILLALGAGAAITAALLNLQVDAKRRITTEFRTFGPNVVIVPRSDATKPNDQNTMDESVRWVVQSKPQGRNYFGNPFLYLVAKVSSADSGLEAEAVIAGTYIDLFAYREDGWKFVSEPLPLTTGDECWVGVNLAKRLELKTGSRLNLSNGGRIESCTLAAILATGGPEDDQALMSLIRAQSLADTPGRISLVKTFVTGTPQKIDETIAVLQSKFPNLDVRPIRQFTEGEARLYNRISGILTATVAVVLILTALCVMAAMTNVAMERKNDVGLMKAIGGSVRRVLRLFLAEAALLGLAGGLIGAAVGIIISIGLGKAVFGVAAKPRLIVYPISVALTVIVAILAAYPLRRLVHIRPAAVFRGEE
jgi:putative ABC transport system permease protein